MQSRDPKRKIFLIATEESGDRLGSALMKVLRQRLGDGVQFVGVGGRTMAREGLETLFPIEELSIVGFAAVVQQLPKILRLIRQTVDAVLHHSRHPADVGRHDRESAGKCFEDGDRHVVDRGGLHVDVGVRVIAMHLGLRHATGEDDTAQPE